MLESACTSKRFGLLNGRKLCVTSTAQCAPSRQNACHRPTFTLGSSRAPAAANPSTDTSLGAVSGQHPQPCRARPAWAI